jgi:TIR domain
MAYIPGCKFDVFISYAHFDNEADTQDIRWVSRFQTDLKKALRQRLGMDPEIFFDTRDLQAHHEIDGLLAEVAASAVFVPILSPSYIKRTWTLKELEAFESMLASDRNRIVTVELLPVKEYDIPPRFLRLKRTQFWWSDENEEDVPLKLTPKSNPDKYDRRLQTLAHQMEELLRIIYDERTGRTRPTAQAARSPEIKPPDGRPGDAKPSDPKSQTPSMTASLASDASPLAGKVVLLAQVTNDLYDERDQVLAYLKQYGADVLPEGEYLQGGAEFASAVKADLERADLFVQLLGPYRSNRPGDLKDDSGGPISYAQFQYAAAKQRGTTVLQWRRPDLDVTPITHWDKPLLEGPEVLAMGLQEFIKEIKKTFERAIAAAAAAAAAGRKSSTNNDFLFINADSSDKDLADQLLKSFEHNPDWMAAGPLFEGSADDITKDLDANLVDCGSLLLVYGNAAAPWVRAQLRRFSKLERLRQEPARTKSVLLAPPGPKPDIGVSGGFQKIDCQNGLSGERLQQIVAELCR